MSSRKEEERNEKIIRGLMKLPPNRRCINCNSLGPQYVCTNFWTLICTACSGIHREFTHRVKSVSMAKFTAQEVEALQKGGNQRAREFFLTDWDAQRLRLPDSSNPDRIREFIKSVYVDKKYAGGKSSYKPPRDMLSHKNHEEDHRRASSYHSYSQSPPYEHQYEDRLYGKQTGMLTRKPGSDRGHYEGKISSFIYSPGRLREHVYEDRFANEGSVPRISDYSVSSAGGTLQFDGQSQNFQRDSGYSSPPMHQVRDILVEDGRRQTSNTYSEANVKRDVDGIPHSQRTTSSGSFGSFDGNSVSLKPVNSGSLIDILESEKSTGIQMAEASTFSSLPQSSISTHTGNQDLFGPPFIQQPATSSAPSIDLFAEINHPSSTTSTDKKAFPVPFSKNEGWATFDLPQHDGPASETKTVAASTVTSADGVQKGTFDAFSSIINSSQRPSVHSSTACEPFTLMADQWNAASHDVQVSAYPTSSQPWNAFDVGNFPQTSIGSLLMKNEVQVPAHMPPTPSDSHMDLKISEDPNKDGFQIPIIDDRAHGNSMPFNSFAAGSSFPPSVVPLMGGNTHDRKTTNPFDLPYDSDLETSNAFLDMSSLQAALPAPQFPAPFLSSLGQPWLPQNPFSPYISSVTPGGLAYMARQPPSSQLPNMPSQGPVASLGGNPFA